MLDNLNYEFKPTYDINDEFLTENENPSTLSYNSRLEPLFTTTDYRHMVVYGGRGGGKSEAVASSLIYKSMQDRLNILCIREIQKSINDSVFSLMCKWIATLNLSKDFKVIKNSITSSTGSKFLFHGMQNHTADSIKSLDNIDVCWVEEAQSLSRRSFDILLPTIRKKDSYIIFTMNPYRPDDPVYEEFIANDSRANNSLVIKVNIEDNPFVSSTLQEEMEMSRKIHSRSRFEHIWHGELIDDTESIFKNSWLLTIDKSKIDKYNTKGIYIVCDTAYKDGKTNDYNCLSCFKQLNDGRIVLFDIDIFKSDYPELKERFNSFYDKYDGYKFIGAYVEDRSSGISLIQENKDKKITKIKRTGTKCNYDEISIPGSKLDRANRILGPLSEKGIYFVKDICGYDEIVKQYMGFPNPIVHDDFIDTMVDMFHIATKGVKVYDALSNFRLT